MSGPVQENKANAPQNKEGAEHGGLSMSPPAFGLASSSGVAQHKAGKGLSHGHKPTHYPWPGLVNVSGASMHKQPKMAGGGAADVIAPVLELSERLEVQAEMPGGWLKVMRDQYGKQVVGYVEKKYVSHMPGQIAHSEHKPGIGYDGKSVADDLKSGDLKDGDELMKLTNLFWLQIHQPDFLNWADLRLMCSTLFSSGDLATNISMMIDHFKESKGTTYSNPILTKAVKEHEKTQAFVNQIHEKFTKKIGEVHGNANALNPESLKLSGRPTFNSSGDTWRGGLTIAVNDVWAYDVNLTDYDRAGDNYVAKVRVNLWDHFGLDKPDVEKKYKYMAGFRAWYVLQHMRGYKPFIVNIPLDYTFTGKIKK